MIVNKLYPFATHSGDEQTQKKALACLTYVGLVAIRPCEFVHP
jgi:hypothetical protein